VCDRLQFVDAENQQRVALSAENNGWLSMPIEDFKWKFPFPILVFSLFICTLFNPELGPLQVLF
jgi:hypothetical protein